VLDALTGQWWPIIKAGQRQDGVSASFGHLHVRTTTRIALDRERKLDAQRHEQVRRRRRPQRDHRGLGIDRPLRGIDAPAARRPMQTQRIALHRDTVERLEPGWAR
jgi:hypothetical protein